MIGLTAIVAATAVAAPVELEAFGVFEALCVKTGAQQAAVLAEADRAGWQAIPPERLQQMQTMSGNPANLKARARRVGDTVQVLVTEHVPAHGPMPTSDDCQLNVQGASYAALLPLAARWAAVPPYSQEDKGTMFVFSDVAGRHDNVPASLMNGSNPQFVHDRHVTSFNVINLSRGAALQIIISAP